MITQIPGKENLLQVFNHEYPIQAIINYLLAAFFCVGNVIRLPCTGVIYVMGQAVRIHNGKRRRTPLIKDGFYTRNLIHVCIKNEKNQKVYHFYREKVKVQRVRSASGHCHALLLDFIVPYEPFTYAAALAILDLYGRSGDSPEQFCMSVPGIDLTVKTLMRLIEWAEQRFGIIGVSLAPEGNGPDAKRQAFSRAAKEIWNNFAEIFKSSISSLKRALFQWRVSKHSLHMTGQPVWQPD
jgi:hypothetical protein